MPSDEPNDPESIQSPQHMTLPSGEQDERRLYPAIGEDRAQALSPIVAALVATVADAVPKLPFDVDVSHYYTLLESFAEADD